MAPPPQQRHHPPAVLVGVDSLHGLQAVRILTKHGVPIIGVVRNPDHYGSRTRLCERIVVTNTKSEELIDCLCDMGPTLPAKAVLVPCTDASVVLISRYRERLSEYYRFVFPEHHVVEKLVNKDSFYHLAGQHGLPIMPTRVLTRRSDAEAASLELDFPVVLKPVLKTPAWEQQSNLKVHKVEDRTTLLELFDRYSPTTDRLIAQEWAEGGDDTLYTTNFYCNQQSELLAVVVARKLRQWPTGAGNGSLREVCRNDTVLDETRRLVEEVGYQGLGYCEFKYDQRRDRYIIIEMNVGRPTGGSAIAEADGVDLLYAMYCDLASLPPPPNLVQKYTGVRWVHLAEDAQSAWHYYRRGELSLGSWARSWTGRKQFAVLSMRDPMPFLHQLMTPVRNWFNRRSAR